MKLGSDLFPELQKLADSQEHVHHHLHQWDEIKQFSNNLEKYMARRRVMTPEEREADDRRLQQKYHHLNEYLNLCEFSEDIEGQEKMYEIKRDLLVVEAKRRSKNES